MNLVKVAVLSVLLGAPRSNFENDGEGERRYPELEGLREYDRRMREREVGVGTVRMDIESAITLFQVVTRAAERPTLLLRGRVILDANRRGEELLGVDRTDLRGRFAREFVAERDRETVASAIDSQSEEPYRATLRTADGWREMEVEGVHVGPLRVTTLREVE